jgi:hypothetical protein
MDLSLIRDNYARMSDAELTDLIRNDLVGLSPEAVGVLKEEISRRKLNISVAEQTHLETTEQMIDQCCEFIRTTDCPSCNSQGKGVRVVKSGFLIGMVLFTQTNVNFNLGCTDCLAKMVNKDLGRTLLLGWWSRVGLFKNIQSILFNLKSKHIIHNGGEDHMREFVTNHYKADTPIPLTYKGKEGTLAPRSGIQTF